MKVIPDSPWVFPTGELLDPADISRLLRYGAQAFKDVASKRFQTSPLVVPFGSAAIPYTNATSAEERTFRFRCPVTCVIEKADFVCNLVAASEVQITLAASGSTGTVSPGAAPDGATTPYISTGAGVSYADATETQRFTNHEPVRLTAGTTYLFTVVGSSFTLYRGDLVLHVRTDRWLPAGTSTLVEPSITYPRASSSRSAAVMVANQTAIADAAASLATYNGACVPVLWMLADFNSATGANYRTFPVPRFQTSRAVSRVVRLDVFAHWSAVTAQAVTATLSSVFAVTIATGTDTATGGTSSTATFDASSPADIESLPASDVSLTFTASGATNVQKAYALAWFSR